jgi:preprotein translocase subunit SecG
MITITSQKTLAQAYNFLDNSGVKDTAAGTGQTSQKLFNSPDSITSGIGLIINSALGLLGVIFLILTIYAGVLWMTAGGEESQVDKSKKILTASIIGLVIVLSAYAITTFVITPLLATTIK